MLATIDFLSANAMERHAGDPGLAVISITDPGATPAYLAPTFGPVLRMQFDDVDTVGIHNGPDCRPFDDHLARSTLSFLDSVNASMEQYGLIVHCEMGRSRSAAVAWFVACQFGSFFVAERRIDGINTLVLDLLDRHSGRRTPRPPSMLVKAAAGASALFDPPP